jgi:hypothetical protein
VIGGKINGNENRRDDDVAHGGVGGATDGYGVEVAVGVAEWL